jgi:hypothetical protein
MKLTWHDAAATVPVAAAVGAYAANRTGAGLPLLSSPRAVATAVFVLGVAACALGGGIATGGEPPRHSPWTMVLWLHGPAALLIAVLVWVTDSSAVLDSLVVLLVLMWLIARTHHVLMPAGSRTRTRP